MGTASVLGSDSGRNSGLDFRLGLCFRLELEHGFRLRCLDLVMALGLDLDMVSGLDMDLDTVSRHLARHISTSL